MLALSSHPEIGSRKNNCNYFKSNCLGHPAVVSWSVERLLHKKCHLLMVVRIPLGTNKYDGTKMDPLICCFERNAISTGHVKISKILKSEAEVELGGGVEFPSMEYMP